MGVGVAVLEEAELGVGVGEVVAQLVEQAAGLDARLDALAEAYQSPCSIMVASCSRRRARRSRFSSFAVDEDVAQRRRGVAGFGAVDVLLDLAVEGELDVEALAPARRISARPLPCCCAGRRGASLSASQSSPAATTSTVSSWLAFL